MALEQWAKDIGLSDEQFAKVQSVLGEDQVKKIEGYGLRQADYDRVVQEAKRAADEREAKLKEEADALEGQMRSVAGYRESLKSDHDKFAKSSQAAVERAAKVEARLRRAAQEAGVDPEEWLKEVGVEPVRETRTETPAFDAKEFESNLMKRIGGELARRENVAAEWDDVAYEHRDLFGDRLDRRKVLQFAREQYERSNGQIDLTPREAWEAVYKPEAKRAEQTEAKTQARIKSAVDDALAKQKTDLMMSGGRPTTVTGEGSPALKLGRVGADGKVSTGASPGHQRAAERIAAAMVK